MNPISPNPEPPASSSPLPRNPGSGADAATAPASLDERVFTAAAIIGVVFIGLVTAFALHRAPSASSPSAGAASSPPQASSHPASPTTSRCLIDFSLTNQTGRVVNRADLEGHLLVVNFVFTSCSLSCLQVNNRMAEIQHRVADQPDVRLLSISLDPRSDTPPALAAFAKRFGAASDRWQFLTGDKQVVYRLIDRSFLGPADPQLAGLIPGGFAHADRIAVVDASGRLRALYNGSQSWVPGEIVENLQKLRKERSTP